MFRVVCVTVLMSLVGGSALTAQEIPEFPKPSEEHQWLEKFVGEWKTECECSMGPGQKPVKSVGTISSRMVGAFWVINEMNSKMMEMPMRGVQTIGYDPEQKKYVGTWVDSMTNFMWHYRGTVDESGRKLTLSAEGPNFMAEGKTAQFRDAYEFKSPDHIIVTSSMQGEDGEWITFMSGDAKRIKK